MFQVISILTKMNSICSLKFSILLFMETALKRLIFISVTFQTLGLDQFAKISANIYSSPNRVHANTKQQK